MPASFLVPLGPLFFPLLRVSVGQRRPSFGSPPARVLSQGAPPFPDLFLSLAVGVCLVMVPKVEVFLPTVFSPC